MLPIEAERWKTPWKTDHIQVWGRLIVLMGQQIWGLCDTNHSFIILAKLQIRYRLVNKIHFNLIFSKAEKNKRRDSGGAKKVPECLSVNFKNLLLFILCLSLISGDKRASWENLVLADNFSSLCQKWSGFLCELCSGVFSQLEIHLTSGDYNQIKYSFAPQDFGVFYGLVNKFSFLFLSKTHRFIDSMCRFLKSIASILPHLFVLLRIPFILSGCLHHPSWPSTFLPACSLLLLFLDLNPPPSSLMVESPPCIQLCRTAPDGPTSPLLVHLTALVLSWTLQAPGPPLVCCLWSSQPTGRRQKLASRRCANGKSWKTAA